MTTEQTNTGEAARRDASALQRVVRRFVVVYDDEMGCCSPMGWDKDCQGALCSYTRTVALFDSRTEARKAIRVSVAFAKLCKEQGRPVNEDFLAGAKFVQVYPCE